MEANIVEQTISNLAEQNLPEVNSEALSKAAYLG